MTVKERLPLFRQMDAQSGWVIIKGELGGWWWWGVQDEVKSDE